MRLRGLLAAGAASVAVFASISAVQGQPSKPNFNQACKAKYPAFASWMETRWTTCAVAPSGPRFEGEQVKAWLCWCRKG